MFDWKNLESRLTKKNYDVAEYHKKEKKYAGYDDSDIAMAFLKK